LSVEGTPINFLLDCGSSVNVLPIEDALSVRADLKALTPSGTKLTMFGNTELKTKGVFTANVQHPLSGKSSRLEFFL